MTGHGEMHYPGDVREDIVGRVMGPTTLGQLLYCYGADYDAAAARTTAHFRPATPDEVEAVA